VLKEAPGPIPPTSDSLEGKPPQSALENYTHPDPKLEAALEKEAALSSVPKTIPLETVARPPTVAEVRSIPSEAEAAADPESPASRGEISVQSDLPSASIMSSLLGAPQVSAKKTSPVLVSRSPRSTEVDPFVNSRTALRPSETSEEEAEKAAMPGMGEMLAANHASLLPGSGEVRPWQSVPFLPVSTSPQKARKLKLTRFRVTGILIFVLVDLLVLGWVFQKPISRWWAGMQEEAAVDPLPTDPAESINTGPEEAPLDSETIKRRLPRNPVPTLDDIREPDISAPSEFPTTDTSTPSPQASLKPVPQAIPIASDSGHAALPEMLEQEPATTPEMAGATSAALLQEAPSPVPISSAASLSEPLPPPSTPPSPPPVPARDTIPASLGGLPPPPKDMAFPNGPPPAEVQAFVEHTSITEGGSQPLITTVPPDAKSALDALLKFLDAPNYRERLKYSPDSPALRAAMEKHASIHGDGPILVGTIEFVERYTNKNGVPPYCMFEVSGGSLPHSVLVLVEQAVKGPAKVDWEAFIEFKDDLLLKFLEAKNDTPQKFRVMVRRKHYFDKDVPDMAGKDGFEVKQPNANFEGHVFVTRDSPLGRQLANQLAWGMDMPIMAELIWKSNGKSNWVEIKSIPSYGWRG